MSEREILDIVVTAFGLVFLGLFTVVLLAWIGSVIERRWRNKW
jgi:hypothetical protein